MKAIAKSKNGGLHTLPSVFDDFFMRDMFDFSVKNKSFDTNSPAVNIKEDDKKFELEFAAPGLKKEDFNVAIEDNMLVVSTEKKEDPEASGEDKQEGYTRKEFSYSSFKRSFRLPENGVETDNIKAKYQDGVLSLELPKVADDKRDLKKVIKVS